MQGGRRSCRAASELISDNWVWRMTSEARVCGEDAVSAINQNLKKKAAHEVREYLVISLYLFIVFSLFVVHKSMILAEHHIHYTLHGFALINALALAKVMLVAQDMHLAD